MSDAPQPKVRFDPTITIGAATQVVVLLVAFVTFLLTGSSEVKNTAQQVQRLENAVAGQANSTREAIRDAITRVETGVAELRKDVGAVPQLGEQLRALDRDVRRHDEDVANIRQLQELRRTSVDQRLDAMRQTLIELRADLNGLQRAQWGWRDQPREPGRGRDREPPTP